ncbi:hypothetical protein OG535_38265 [Kitasatospora sp. NBC_00085]|uniref:hypothetical protein n=1 Tax=unclassified Kitasatospora TaxID=2633591 RepID=UPI003247539E
MSAAGWIVLIVLAAAGAAGWRLCRYPGAWRHAFAPEHDAARRDLAAARGALRAAKQRRKKDLGRARGAVRAAADAHRRRIRAIEQRIAALREPGRGEPRDELGPLSLHEHVLGMRTGDERADLPLHEIAVRSDHAPTANHVYVVDPQGRQHLLTYPAAEADEDRVRRFVVDVHNAIADAKAAQRDRDSRIREAEAELRRVQEDTGKQTRAQLHLDETTARWDADASIPAAKQDLEAAKDRWQALTGRRPR